MKNEEQTDSSSRKPIIFKILKIVWKIIEKIIMLLIIFVSIIIMTQKLSNNDKAFLGLRIFRVQTGSMIPKYQIGDVILVKQKDIEQIKIGDDVTYWGISGSMKGKLVTHQVINIEEVDGQKVFHTKGIANNKEDPLVYTEQINGVVQGKLYVMTLITLALSNKYIFYFCGILPLTVFVFFAFIGSNKKKLKQYKK